MAINAVTATLDSLQSFFNTRQKIFRLNSTPLKTLNEIWIPCIFYRRGILFIKINAFAYSQFCFIITFKNFYFICLFIYLCFTQLTRAFFDSSLKRRFKFEKKLLKINMWLLVTQRRGPRPFYGLSWNRKKIEEELHSCAGSKVLVQEEKRNRENRA